MFNLLITSLLCLFSLSSGHISYDQQGKESKPIQNYAYNDEYGYQYALSKFDLYGGEFIVNFLNNLSGEPGSIYYGLSFNSTSTGSFTLDGINATICRSVNGELQLTSIQDYNSININKYSVVLYDDDPDAEYYVMQYSLSFRYNDTLLCHYTYYFSVPFYDDNQHQLANVQLTRSIFTRDLSTIDPNQNYHLFFYENTNDSGFCPFIEYILKPYLDGGGSEYNRGFWYGYNQGYDKGNNTVNYAEYQRGRRDGLAEGYTRGLIDGANYDETALTIFTGIIDIGLLPVNFFLEIFNYEVFGINVSGLITALCTIAIVIILVRVIMGASKHD